MTSNDGAVRDGRRVTWNHAALTFPAGVRPALGAARGHPPAHAVPSVLTGQRPTLDQWASRAGWPDELGDRVVPLTAYLDESARRGYLVCAVVVVGDPAAVRSSVRALPRRGSSRVHMVDESPRQRRAVLSAVADLPIDAHIAQSELQGRSQRQARDRCLAELVRSLVGIGVTDLVIESCDQDRQDRTVIARALRDLDLVSALTYGHRRPNEEVLLWLPDVIAWAHGRGGEWRVRAAPVVRTVHRYL